MISPVYKTRSTGTGNVMGKAGNEEECYIPGNVAKHSGECF